MLPHSGLIFELLYEVHHSYIHIQASNSFVKAVLCPQPMLVNNARHPFIRAVKGAEAGMLSSLTEKLEGKGVKGDAGRSGQVGGKLRAVPPKGRMNLRRVPHRPVKVEVSRQTAMLIGRDAPVSVAGPDPSSF